MPSPATGPAKRSYREYCAIARALDLLGERWTLLVVRDLLLGPKRYTDLQRGLPGIATDILTARLRTLETAGFIARRELPPPAPAMVYELSESGRGLAPVVAALGEVGLRLLGQPSAHEPVNAEPVVLSLYLSFRADVAGDLDETYELRVDGERYGVSIAAATVEITRGGAAGPAATLTTDARTLVALLRREASPADALAGGRLRINGDRAAVERFVEAFGHTSVAVDSGSGHAVAGARRHGRAGQRPL